METKIRGFTPTKFAASLQIHGRSVFKFVLASVALAVLPHAEAELIPAARLVSWSPGVDVGVPGGIPTNRTVILDASLPPYNADRTGATDAAPAIQAAINAASAGTVVYLPPGTYRLDSTLTIGANKDGITLRGAGPGATILDTRAPTGIFVGTASDYRWDWPSSGNIVSGIRTKNTSTLTLASTTAFSVGQMVQIKISDQVSDAAIQQGAAPVVHTSAWKENRRMKTRVVAKTATTLTISPSLYFDCTGFVTTVNVAQAQTDNVGIEDFTLECLNGTAIMGVEFEQCYSSWIKNVKVNNATNYAFFFYDSLNCELRHSYANQRKGTGTNGAGILCNTSSACLIEDNIVLKFFPLVEVNHGSSGNVFAYNLLEDSRVFGVLGAGLDTNHGPHNSYNLYEGNITPNVQADGFFGSASEDTVFRNWIHGTVYDGSATGFVVSLNRFTRNYSLVGNILGNAASVSVYSFGNPNMGNSSSIGTAEPKLGAFWSQWAALKSANPGQGPGPSGFQERDLDVAATTILKGNYHVKGGAIPATEALDSESLPNSLFRSSKPAWFGDLAWPPYHPTGSQPQYTSIPAGYRYVHGSDPTGQTSPSATMPVVTLQPQSMTAAIGGAVTFTTAASGSPTPTLQWYKDGVAISGATNASYTIPTVSSADAGTFTVVASNSAGRATSSAAVLIVTPLASAPIFTTHPTSRTVIAGSSTTFTAIATGYPTPTYQWTKNGAAIAGATGASFTHSNVTSADAGTFAVIATNSAGSATSTGATLVVLLPLAPPIFTIQPASRTVRAGNSAIFTSLATGNPAPTYQWRKNGINISGATAASYNILKAASTDAGIYTVVASNAVGVATSNNAVLTVTLPLKTPMFTTQPVSRTVTIASPVTFTSLATGNPTPTYQWRKNGTNIAGATRASFTIASVSFADTATYSVVAKNSQGSAASTGADLTVIPAPALPTFTAQPSSRTVTVGTSTTFTAAATGYPAPVYQWCRNGIPISGATGASYNIASVASADSGSYTIAATNSLGTATSTAAHLTVNPSLASPIFVVQPTSIAVNGGTPVTLSALANGYPAPSYQWQKNGIAIAGATDVSLLIASTGASDAGNYNVMATNSVGSTTSTTAVLSVNVVQPPRNAIADFNGDLQSDIIWQNVQTGQTGIWLMDGVVMTAVAEIPGMSSGWEIAGNGDFNGDGKTDLLWQHAATKEFGVLLMDGTKTANSVTLGTLDAWHCEAAGDFNGDGKNDILLENRATGARTILAMNGTTRVGFIDLGIVGPNWRVTGTGDFNGDGKTDLVWENLPMDLHGLWLMTGTISRTWVDLGRLRPAKEISGTGDFNGDGSPDIIWRERAAGDCEITFMSGTTVLSTMSLGAFQADWTIRN